MTTEPTKTEVGSYFISNYPPFSQWTAEQVPVAMRATELAAGRRAPGTLPPHPVLSQAVQVLLLPRLHGQGARARSRPTWPRLSQEIELLSQLPCMGGRPFRFVYFGGGHALLPERQATDFARRPTAGITSIGTRRRRSLLNVSRERSPNRRCTPCASWASPV